MIELDVLWVLVLGELSMIALIVAIGLGVSLLLQRRRVHAMARQLTEQLNDNLPDRQDALRQVLADYCGLSQQPLEDQARDLIRKEERLYLRALKSHLLGDPMSLLHLNSDLDQLISAYWMLMASRQSIDLTPETQVDHSELEALQDANLQLQQELKITMDTMSRMLDDYSMMFSGGNAEVRGYFDDALDARPEPDVFNFFDHSSSAETTTGADAASIDALPDSFFDAEDSIPMRSNPPPDTSDSPVTQCEVDSMAMEMMDENDLEQSLGDSTIAIDELLADVARQK